MNVDWIPSKYIELFAIFGLLIVVGLVWLRIPKVDLGHDKKFLRRRGANWLPLGLTYTMLYMARYNIKVSQHTFGDILFAGKPLMTNQDFATIFLAGTVTYGSAFLINGPLTDTIGGKRAIIIGAVGSALANLAIGICTFWVAEDPASSPAIAANLTTIFALLYAINMYFQSFGAVAIVKVNAPWFYVRERGNFGAIFGILISLGIYFAFDVSKLVIESLSLHAAFFVPAIALFGFATLDYFFVENSPGEAGYDDFDPGDASEDGPQMPVGKVIKMMFTNPVIVTIALIEFCSGFMRNAIMQWFRSFAKQTDATLHLKGTIVYEHWGFWLCTAGILGGVFAGFVSDAVFKSRRGPVASVLYAGMLCGAVALVFFYQTEAVGWIAILMTLCVVGVHGMLSGTASMDFGGKQNVGIAVGIIDGFVYAGTGFMSLLYIFILPDDTPGGDAADPDAWINWPLSMIPISLVGLLLATRLWNARPHKRAASISTTDDPIA